jgi:hypothetical protein
MSKSRSWKHLWFLKALNLGMHLRNKKGPVKPTGHGACNAHRPILRIMLPEKFRVPSGLITVAQKVGFASALIGITEGICTSAYVCTCVKYEFVQRCLRLHNGTYLLGWLQNSTRRNEHLDEGIGSLYYLNVVLCAGVYVEDTTKHAFMFLPQQRYVHEQEARNTGLTI